MPGLSQLAPESIYHIASFLSTEDATSFACTHSSFRDAGQRSVFRAAVFKNGLVDERLLQFMRSLYARPDMGKYVQTLHVEPFLPIAHPGQRETVLKTIDGLWVHLPGLKRLTLLWHSSLDALTFDGCTDSLVALAVTQCTDAARALIRRNRGLKHLSVLGLADGELYTHTLAFDSDVPRLTSVRADVALLQSLVPGRDVAVLCISHPVTLEEFIAAAPFLSQTTAQLRKLYLYFSGNDLTQLSRWSFISPFKEHSMSLTSLTIKLALSSFNYTDIQAICDGIPSALKALRTLRLWLPGPLGDVSWRNGYGRFTELDVDDDHALVQSAHKRCPSLRHVSFFYRIDWHYLPTSGAWFPLVRGSHKRSVAAWLGAHTELEELSTTHDAHLDSVDTDSLVSEPQDYVEYEPSDDDSDWSQDSELTADAWNETDLLEELQELAEEDEQLPPPTSGLTQDEWNEILSVGMREHAVQAAGPKPDPEIAALLEEVAAAAHSGTA
ncbi:hypothetical protein EXIGLDRAFT_828579 [Exidia glandulosa HHB12029]|uniref:F-box domain-containing protein n=1 Tax=Exidia glandulosa HHB12029 TaxID=1314781 RepID=A0A165Q7N2_EXIGL|nr:hypothetical protein EXIGLDRAFT_828579 [Exidia glandulosa HHB12029]